MQDEARSRKILHDINLAKCGGSTQLFLNYCKLSDLPDVLIQDQWCRESLQSLSLKCNVIFKLVKNLIFYRYCFGLLREIFVD